MKKHGLTAKIVAATLVVSLQALFVPASAEGQSAEERLVVDQAQEVIMVTLPFTPAALALDPHLHLLSEMRPPEQVDALQPCAP